MRLDKYLADFERTVSDLPATLGNWRSLPAVIRDGFFEELVGMLARRRRAEREALHQNRPEVPTRLAELHGKLILIIAEFGQSAGILPEDVMPDRPSIAVIDCTAQPGALPLAA